MRTLQELLRFTILDRARAFAEQIERHRSGLGSSSTPGLNRTLELFRHYTTAMREQVERSWVSAADEETLLAELRYLMAHLLSRVDLFDDRFTRGNGRVPRSLVASLERECESFGLSSREAVLTVGPPGNFVTFVADLKAILFKDIPVPALPDHLMDFNPVMIAVPDLEGTRASWHPVIIGHELAHYLQRARPVAHLVDLRAAMEPTQLAAASRTLPRAPGLSAAGPRALLQVAVRWLNELICDAYAVHRFGAAGVAAICEFLESVGASDTCSSTHPPGRLRAQLMLKWLGEDLSAEEGRIVEPFKVLASKPVAPPWASYLADVFFDIGAEIESVVAMWSKVPSYQSMGRSELVGWLAHQLDEGMPGREYGPMGGALIAVNPADMVNACWLAMVDETQKPVDRLTAKALDNLDFLDKWTDAAGELPDYQIHSSQTYGEGVLAAEDLTARLNAKGNSGIRVTPRIPDSIHGASIDVRLGNQFIVFQKSAAASFDALEETQDPRSMQIFVEKAWGDTFHLHPGQLVLAATLEYIILPADLTAQVITRSSYGRLGLITATAVQVHPLFAGCLTLELVNHGEMPLTVTPGERIAQLVFTTTSRMVQGSQDKYRYPTGPEFSRIRTDGESNTLRRMRERFVNRRT